MARALCRLPQRGLWLLLAHHLFVATACQEANYGALLQELCLTQFQVDMEAVGETLWCDWGRTIGSYRELADCTWHMARTSLLHGPTQRWTGSSLAVAQHYFRACPISGSASTPSSWSPSRWTLLVTALVFWQSKHTEGIV
uniref:Receptor activity-modifying protein 1 n=1 Tax=Rhinopithecus bieti TaxID=61621 RepID=A0A2K6K6G1_RHIBE